MPTPIQSEYRKRGILTAGAGVAFLIAAVVQNDWGFRGILMIFAAGLWLFISALNFQKAKSV
jgi:hypothetical protein